jgi:hypothetical protein
MVVRGAVGWSKVGALLGLAGLVLGLGAGCGSRTSMLDQEGYLASVGNGATGGGGSSGKAGNAAGGAMNPGAINPMVAQEPCKRYCSGFQVACSADLGGRDCVATCVAEANRNDTACQSAAIGVLDCYSPFFMPGQDCESANARGGAACDEQLSRYNQCMGGGERPMMPSNPVTPRRCRTITSSGGETCFELLGCVGGDFLVECSPSNGGTRCSCSGPSSSTSFEYGPMLSACQRARIDCGLD